MIETIQKLNDVKNPVIFIFFDLVVQYLKNKKDILQYLHYIVR